MSVNLNNDGTLAITAMSLVEFLPEIETAIHNGFMLNLNKNEGVPQQFGSMLVLTMYPTDGVVQAGEVFEEAPEASVKEVDVPVTEEAPKEVVPETVSTPIVQRGRPKAK
jgi:hypothetical protein